jgi:hypothetical protein
MVFKLFEIRDLRSQKMGLDTVRYSLDTVKK